MRIRTVSVAALTAALLAPTAASAQEPLYPEPSEPGKIAPKPRGPFRTHVVCKTRKRGCDFTRIQAAVDAAKKGDTIRIRPGIYREGVRIRGAGKSYLKLIGDPRRPARVVLDGTGVRGGAAQNGVAVNEADAVTINGITARDFKANGFFITNAVDYTLRNLVAAGSGAYCLYAFNSKGGEMSDSEAYYFNDAGIYVGQTPSQARPIRTLITNVKSWGNVQGYTGTNSRYVTITRSQFYNNGIGVVPNSLDSERFPPNEDNVIRDNEIFWNNFDFRRGAPFPQRNRGTAALAPIGTGLLLLGGRRNVVENNRIYGHYLSGLAVSEGVLNEDPAIKPLISNTVRGNAFGLNGTDKNGRDLYYDGNGTNNCFASNTGVEVTLPADGSTFAACPFTGANTFNSAAQAEALSWTGAAAPNFWIRTTHAPKAGFTPLEVFTP